MRLLQYNIEILSNTYSAFHGCSGLSMHCIIRMFTSKNNYHMAVIQSIFLKKHQITPMITPCLKFLLGFNSAWLTNTPKQEELGWRL